MGCRFHFGVPGAAITYEVFKLGVFFIVAINAEELPVTSVAGIIVVIVIEMMYSQLLLKANLLLGCILQNNGAG